MSQKNSTTITTNDNTTTTTITELSSSFPLHGVKLAFLNEFIQRCGGEEALANKTTRQVCEDFIKPMTLLNKTTAKVSFCDLLRVENPSFMTDKATCFISHTWNYNFLDFIHIVQDHFQQRMIQNSNSNNEIVLWIDIFCFNQHLPFDANNFLQDLPSALLHIGHFLLVLAPWYDPIPLKRVWCIYEAYCASTLTVTGKCTFSIAMSQTDSELFLKVNMIDHILSFCWTNQLSLFV